MGERSARTRPFGIPGLELAPGDHICALYRGEDNRDAITIPFLRAGLDAGDKCVCILDSTDPAEYWTRLGAVEEEAAEQVEILDSESTYLRSDVFDPETMIGFWDEQARQSLGTDTYDFVRSVGEMTWALQGLPSLEPLLTYEARLNSFVPRYPQVNLCLYDLEAFDGELIVDMLKIHPQVLVSGVIVDNPFHAAPEDLLAEQFETGPAV